MSSKILEGTALSTPSCSTACTNLLCSSGVQSTYTQFKKITLSSLSYYKKKKKKQKIYESSSDLMDNSVSHDSRDPFGLMKFAE
jgi:hypothetical protein